MFKAKLVEDENYYNLRRKQLLLMLLPLLPIAIVVNFYTVPNWLTIAMIALYILAAFLMYKNQRRINSILGNKLIEIDENEIRVKLRNGTQHEVFNMGKVEKIIVKDDYSIPQETIQEIGKEISGESKQNYLIIQKNGKKIKLEFEIDSYYMIEQLSKIIKKWEVRGYNVEMINTN